MKYDLARMFTHPHVCLCLILSTMTDSATVDKICAHLTQCQITFQNAAVYGSGRFYPGRPHGGTQTNQQTSSRPGETQQPSSEAHDPT
uniref:Secreted protein n=1 Tax=Ascaris lumbricoides TaxID=6252 RepID=A0A0M3HQX6_ASCLU